MSASQGRHALQLAPGEVWQLASRIQAFSVVEVFTADRKASEGARSATHLRCKGRVAAQDESRRVSRWGMADTPDAPWARVSCVGACEWKHGLVEEWWGVCA